MRKVIIDQISVCLAQLNFKVGDLAANFVKICEVLNAQKADLYIFTELAITGYPPEDLLLFPDFIKESEKYVEKLVDITKEKQVAIAIGAPYVTNGLLYNAVLFIDSGNIRDIITKRHLPNYGVFDEKRYFEMGSGPKDVVFRGKKLRFYICEDLWQDDGESEGVDLIVSVNASPYEINKRRRRYLVAKKQYDKFAADVIYLNQVGAQDGLVFDGNSFVMHDDNVSYFSSHQEEIICNYLPLTKNEFSEEEEIYNSLMLGLKDYIEKNNFKQVVLGLSGGMDSAFCAALACDALGVQNVNVVKLSSKYTSDLSVADADYFIKKSGCKEYSVSISELSDLVSFKLSEIFSGMKSDLTEENIQSRLRGVLLMALSNKFAHLLVTTGNKSEYATGYATLYGDMCGGYAPIKDIYKTDLYKLARYRNSNVPSLSKFQEKDIFNQSVLSKEPTAELRDDQKDSDSLPEYEILDNILKLLIEERCGAQEIIKKGYTEETVKKVVKLLRRSEYKRYQAIVGTKINKNSFSKDWRMPLTNGYDS